MSKCCKSCVYEDPAYQEALSKVIRRYPGLKERQEKFNAKKQRHEKLENGCRYTIIGLFSICTIVVVASFINVFSSNPQVNSIIACGIELVIGMMIVILLIVSNRMSNKFWSNAAIEDMRLYKEWREAFHEVGYELI